MGIALETTLVKRMKGTVIMIINAKKITNVEQTIAEVYWVFILNLTAATV